MNRFLAAAAIATLMANCSLAKDDFDFYLKSVKPVLQVAVLCVPWRVEARIGAEAG